MQTDSSNIEHILQGQSGDEASPMTGDKIFVIYSDFSGGADRLKRYVTMAEGSRGIGFWGRNLDVPMEVFGKASDDPERQTILSAIEFAEDFEKSVVLGYDLTEIFRTNPQIDIVERRQIRRYVLIEKAKAGLSEKSWNSLNGYVEFRSAELPVDPSFPSVITEQDYLSFEDESLEGKVKALLTEGASKEEVAENLGISWLKMKSVKKSLRSMDKRRKKEMLDESCGPERSHDYGWYRWKWGWDSKD